MATPDDLTAAHADVDGMRALLQSLTSAAGTPMLTPAQIDDALALAVRGQL